MERTVMANNSLGREKEMDLEEYTRRAVTDHGCMCDNHLQFEVAERLRLDQLALAESCFNSLWVKQGGEIRYLKVEGVQIEARHLHCKVENRAGEWGYIVGWSGKFLRVQWSDTGQIGHPDPGELVWH